uniref:Uncharacterized protein n=1 Tax=Tanacetum cinerariifolium TaxID=118510 RepID=A0A6L2JW57_TANCI|nr:hypothetical protein [Tanacetum cinerariifolium]
MGCLPRSTCLGLLSLTQSLNSLVLGDGLEIQDNHLCTIREHLGDSEWSRPAGLKLFRENIQLRVKEEDSITDVENAVFDLRVMDSLSFLFIDQRVLIVDCGSIKFGVKHLFGSVVRAMVSSGGSIVAILENVNGFLAVNTLPDDLIRIDFKQEGVISKDRTYGKVTCIAHKLEGQVPIRGNKDWCFSQFSLKCLKGFNTLIGEEELSIFFKKTGHRPSYLRKVLYESSIEADMTKKATDTLDGSGMR